MLHEQRMKQLRSDIEQIKKETEQIKNETDQIRSETEQLKLENARLKELNANGRALLSSIDQLCFAPYSSSTPTPATANVCSSSSS